MRAWVAERAQTFIIALACRVPQTHKHGPAVYVDSGLHKA